MKSWNGMTLKPYNNTEITNINKKQDKATANDLVPHVIKELPHMLVRYLVKALNRIQYSLAQVVNNSIYLRFPGSQ